MKIRRRLVQASAALAALVAFQAHAIPFLLDEKLGEANMGNSSIDAEVAELAALLGVDADDLEFDSKNDAPTAQVNDADSWFIDVDPNEPGFFILKFGTGGTSVANDTYFFRNINELTKLVFSNAQVNFLTGGSSCTNCNIGRLSHYTLVDGDRVTVSEPASLTLLGLAAMMMGLRRRRPKVV